MSNYFLMVFDQDDLAYNRKGKLTTFQIDSIVASVYPPKLPLPPFARLITRTIGFALLFGWVFLFIRAETRFFLIDNTFACVWCSGTLMLATLPLFWSNLSDESRQKIARRERYRAKIVAERIDTFSGEYTLKVKRNSVQLHLGEQAFVIAPRLASQLQSGMMYRFYVLPESKILLSFEPCTNDFMAEKVKRTEEAPLLSDDSKIHLEGNAKQHDE